MQIGKYTLDKSQSEIVQDESDYLLVTAGAGSGKTLTILGKINYLIKEKKITGRRSIMYFIYKIFS